MGTMFANPPWRRIAASADGRGRACDSPAYQQIAPLRSRHIDGDIVLVEGVPEGYDPAPAAKAVREALPAE